MKLVVRTRCRSTKASTVIPRFRGFVLRGLANTGCHPHDSDPEMDRNRKSVRQFDMVFETCCLVFRERERERSSCHRSVSAKKRNTKRYYNNFCMEIG
jgi:hypothetical protein